MRNSEENHKNNPKSIRISMINLKKILQKKFYFFPNLPQHPQFNEKLFLSPLNQWIIDVNVCLFEKKSSKCQYLGDVMQIIVWLPGIYELLEFGSVELSERVASNVNSNQSCRRKSVCIAIYVREEMCVHSALSKHIIECATMKCVDGMLKNISMYFITSFIFVEFVCHWQGLVCS